MRTLFNKVKIMVVRILIFSAVTVSFLVNSATSYALLQTGTQAPAFTLKDIENKEVSLSQFHNKKAVVVVFWSTWSAKSSTALKRFENFYKKYKDRGIEILAINADSQSITEKDIEEIKKIAKELNISFPILIDKELQTFHNYSIIALPSTVIISEGKIAYELPSLPLVGTEEMFDFLLVLAGEQPKKLVEPTYKPRHDAIANTNLAKGFVSRKKYDMAYNLFKKAIEKDSRYILAYIELAKLYGLEGKNNEAENTFKNALNVEPENVVTISEYGYFLTKLAKTKDAIALLDKAIKKNSYTPAYYYLAFALAKNGQMKESMSAFDSAISMNPFDPKLYLLRGEVYEDNKMLKEAVSDYKKALKLILKLKD